MGGNELFQGPLQFVKLIICRILCTTDESLPCFEISEPRLRSRLFPDSTSYLYTLLVYFISPVYLYPTIVLR